jgi:hypothetical protein
LKATQVWLALEGTRLTGNTKAINRSVTRPAEVEGIIDLDQREECAACGVPVDRCSNYIAIIVSWEHRDRRIPVRDLPGDCVIVDNAEELAVFCSEECLHEGLKRGLA